MAAPDVFTLWRNRLDKGNLLQRGFWRAVFYLGRGFSLGNWNPFKSQAGLKNPPLKSVSSAGAKPKLKMSTDSSDSSSPKAHRKVEFDKSIKYQPSFFTTHPDAEKLLKFVQEANYAEVRRMVRENPELMFQSILDKKTNEITTPLKSAVYLLDTSMWEMLFEIAKATPNHLNIFKEQFNQQTNYINLDNFYAGYETFNNKFDAWLTGKVSTKDLTTAWRELGMLQRQNLPRHMLKEFCHPGISWDTSSRFDIDAASRPSAMEVLNYNSNQKERVVPLPQNIGLGFSFALMRGKQQTEAEVWEEAGTHLSIRALRDDANTFRHLHKVRANDVTQFREKLEMTSPSLGNRTR